RGGAHVLVPLVFRQRLRSEAVDVQLAGEAPAERFVERGAEGVEHGDRVAAVAADAERLLHGPAAEASAAGGSGGGDGGAAEHGQGGARDVLGEAVRLERAG